MIGAGLDWKAAGLFFSIVVRGRAGRRRRLGSRCRRPSAAGSNPRDSSAQDRPHDAPVRPKKNTPI